MSTREDRPSTTRGYDVQRPRAAGERERAGLGPYERSYELRRGYEAPAAPREESDRSARRD